MHLNLLSFEPVSDTITMNFYTEKVEKTRPQIVYKDECPELWEQYPDVIDKYKSLFCSFSNEEEVCKGDKLSATINLHNAPRFALHYFRFLMFNHFLGKAAAVGIDFVDDIEVWIKAPIQPEANATLYNKFALSPQYSHVTDGFELLVSYNGASRTYNKPVTQLSHIDPVKFTLVISGGTLLKFKKMTPEQKDNVSHTYPVLNYSLAALLGVPEKRYLNPNKYLSTYKHISEFCSEQLFTSEFLSVINITGDGFIPVPDKYIHKTSPNSNILLFGQNTTHVSPYDGMKKGPFRAPEVKNNKVGLIFICQESDKQHAIDLYNVFKNGVTVKKNGGTDYLAFPPLAEYIKQPFYTSKELNISFSSLNNAVQEVKNKLSTNPLDDLSTYVAIYISPIKKDDVDNPNHGVYYKIKELLLDRGITSQVIYKERHKDTYFSFHLPNIAIALIAKLGGIPWQLSKSSKNDLIIGVGAFRSAEIGKRYVGSAFCFSKDGLFQNFSCHRDNDLSNIVAQIRKALMHYVVENDKAERLIIHYYKTMSKREAKPIVDMLHKLGLNIPVIILTINKTESYDIVAFNTQVSDLMPLSGQIIKVGHNQFLLYNSAKYDEGFAQSKGKKDYPFPIKIKLATTSKDTNLQMSVVSELLDQVYQFSRMYWKAVKQQNLPITIKYPEMVAEIVPHFSDAELPQFGKSNLWFL